jgi:hypothetical protein
MSQFVSRNTRLGWMMAGELLLTLLITAGCGPADSPQNVAANDPQPDSQTPSTPTAASDTKPPPQTPQPSPPPTTKRPGPNTKRPSPPPNDRSLADLMELDDGPNPFDRPKDPTQPGGGNTARGGLQPLAIDEAKAAAAGIRKLQGKYVTLYTDVPSAPDVDELPAVFDKAVPQWCEYFEIDPARVESWRMSAFLMDRKELFQATGLLPRDLPAFPFGFQRGLECWVHEQSSAYYRRHLLLHEGTHGFMQAQLGGGGPPWYMEGAAELLGTHRWQNGQLTLRYFPKNRDEVPDWGRTKIVRDALAEGRGMTLMDVMKYSPTAHREKEPYGWSWAAAAFFDNHPQYRAAFRELRKDARDTSLEFSRRFYDKLKDQWPQVVEQWQLFVIDMDYGYDVARAAIEYKPGQPLGANNDTATIAADRGWQSTGIRLEAGMTYQITANGRYQVADQPKIWWCEPSGVTIRYDHGRPLGQLLAAVRDDAWPADSITPLAAPEPIGLAREINFPRAGTLYLRINESAAGLSDNAGQIQVRVAVK